MANKTSPDLTLADIAAKQEAEPIADQADNAGYPYAIGAYVPSPRDNRSHAINVAARAMSGTNGVTAKALLYLANEIEKYTTGGYDADRYNDLNL